MHVITGPEKNQVKQVLGFILTLTSALESYLAPSHHLMDSTDEKKTRYFPLRSKLTIGPVIKVKLDQITVQLFTQASEALVELSSNISGGTIINLSS